MDKKDSPAVIEVTTGLQDVVCYKGLTLFPVEHAFFDGVNVANCDESQKPGHTPEDARSVRFDHRLEVHRPRIEKNHLDIEKDKEHRDEVKLHRKSRLCLTLRQHSALVGQILGRCALRGFPEKDADEQRNRTKSENDSDL